MEAEFRELVRQGEFSKLLEKTEEALSTSLTDSCALAYKGRALASLRRYEEAILALQAAVRVPGKRLTALKELEKYCRRLHNFEQKYEYYSKVQFPADWLASRLAAAIESQPVPTTPLAINQVAVLGPASIVSSFHSVDHGVCRQLKQPLPPFPLAQADSGGFVYSKTQTYLLPFGYSGRYYKRYGSDGPQPVALFPTVSWNETAQQPNPRCDVFYSTQLLDSTAKRLLQWSLDAVGKERKDYFVPMYHNIIDPNLSALMIDGRYFWTATDFVVEEVKVPRFEVVLAVQGCVRRKIGRGLPWHSVQLILSFIDCYLVFGQAHMASPLPFLERKELGVAVETVLTAALPLLAKLRKPALLLPGKLQVVVKAQSIYLLPGEEYSGVWHYDGLNEHIVAVVLYYYRYSPEMEGGDLEFVSRQPREKEFWLYGDCDPDAMSLNETKNLLEELPHCRVPMQQGLLVVFSNYQLVHRVLTMRNSSGEVAQRDFLVLFVADQRVPLPSTAELPAAQDRTASEKVRKQLFFEQLEPSGKFGVYNDTVYSTGNGSCALIGWMEANSGEADTNFGHHEDRSGLKALKALSKNPPLGRGMSWVLEPEAWDEDEQVIT